MAVVVSLLASRAAEAAKPCEGCVSVNAEGPPGRPLVVLLHGDEGTPHKLVSLWRATAKARDLVLFAPRCPRAEGCTGSWWRWGGDPSWLLDAVEEMSAAHEVDEERRYLVGWSGGATYMGMNGARWFHTFAAIALAGGGAPPSDDACHPSAGGSCAPVYHLMGDSNPHFALAEATRSYFVGCGHAVTQVLRRGAGHTAEWHAFAHGHRDLVDWLLARPRDCPPPSSAASAAAAPSAKAPPSEPRHENEGPAAAAPGPREARCGCKVAGFSPPRGAPGWWLPLLLFAARRRTQRTTPTLITCHSAA